MDVSTDIPTVSEFLALNPGERLKFALDLSDRVTPEVVALVIHTYLTTPMIDPRTRPAYREAMMALIKRVDPIALFVLANRFVNTSTAKGEFLPVHQDMGPALHKLHGMNRSYVRITNGEFHIGPLSHRTFPRNIEELLEAGMQLDDVVLYREGGVRRNRITQRNEVDMILVPMNNNLPSTLGRL